MDLKEIKQYVVSKLQKKISSHVFLNNMRVADNELKNSFIYNDYTYVPFYYWLGQILKSENIIEIGFKFGFLSGNFLKSCKTVKKFLAFQEIKTDYYSPRLGISNIRDIYKGRFYVHTGNINEDLFENRLRSCNFDLVIINEETNYDKYRTYFDLLWPQINGLIVMDLLKKYKSAKMAFEDFCKSKNIEYIFINTTYGVGIAKR